MMRRLWVALAFALLSAVACEKSEIPATEVLFTVSSELSGVASVDAQLFDPTELAPGQLQSFNRAPPFSFAVVPAAQRPLNTMLMVLTAKGASGEVVAVHKTVFSFIEAKTILIELRFSEACRGLTCERGQTCVAAEASVGACALTPTAPGREIPPVTEPGSEFSGMQGVGGGDAGNQQDGGVGVGPDGGGTLGGGLPDAGGMPGVGPFQDAGGGLAGDGGQGGAGEAGPGNVDAAPPAECDATNPCATPGYVCESSVCVSRCQQTKCDPNATCALVNAAPVCSCNSGFIAMAGAGGAVTCTKDVQCSELGCDPVNATCEVGTDQLRKCVCKTGFMGSGQTCTPISCGALTIANGNVDTQGSTFGKTATYTCDSGYTKTGGTTRKCEVAGWSGTAPTCAPFDCGTPASPSHGKATVTNGTKFPSGTVRYSCDANFTLSTSSDTRTCLATGWSGSAPTCRGCGDGAVDGLREQCDIAALGQDPWSCTSTCRLTHSYMLCHDNSDCDSGQTCYLNKCTITTCASASDCPVTPSGGGNPMCQGGLCFVRCSTASQCPKGLICRSENGLCDGCLANEDCPAFQRCIIASGDGWGSCGF